MNQLAIICLLGSISVGLIVITPSLCARIPEGSGLKPWELVKKDPSVGTSSEIDKSKNKLKAQKNADDEDDDWQLVDGTGPGLKEGQLKKGSPSAGSSKSTSSEINKSKNKLKARKDADDDWQLVGGMDDRIEEEMDDWTEGEMDDRIEEEMDDEELDDDDDWYTDDEDEDEDDDKDNEIDHGDGFMTIKVSKHAKSDKTFPSRAVKEKDRTMMIGGVTNRIR